MEDTEMRRLIEQAGEATREAYDQAHGDEEIRIPVVMNGVRATLRMKGTLTVIPANQKQDEET